MTHEERWKHFEGHYTLAPLPDFIKQEFLRHLREVEAEAKQPPAWIPCSERMPNNSDFGLMWNVWKWNHEDQRVCLVSTHEGFNTKDCWMPTNLIKPEPPKETTK